MSDVDARFDPGRVDDTLAQSIAHVDALDTAMSTRSATPIVDVSLTANRRRAPTHLIVDSMIAMWGVIGVIIVGSAGVSTA